MSNISDLDRMTREELQNYYAELQQQVTELTAMRDWLLKQLQLNKEDIPVRLRHRLDMPRHRDEKAGS